jgi:FG-GAP-like repeat/S-layer homology domain
VIRSLLRALTLLAISSAAVAQEPPCGGVVGPSRVRVAGNPTGVAVADLDLDGLPDVATVSTTSISVAFGDALTGLRAGPSTPATSTYGQTLLAGDFDEDGKPDLIGIDELGPISFFRGKGDGTFEAPVTVGYVNFPGEMTTGDVDGDGHVDLVGVGLGNAVFVYLGHGDGTFDAPLQTPLDGTGNSIALGDLDGDGNLDAVVGGYGSEALVVLHGAGDGTFVVASVLDSSTQWFSVRLADFDGNGTLDVVGVQSPGTLEVFPGLGDGSFGAPRPAAGGPYPWRIATADFNGDGILDVAVSQSNGYSPAAGGLLILIGRGDGTLDTGDAYAVGAGGGGLAIADFDGDGRVDVVVAPNFLPEVWWLAGRGDGGLRAIPYALFNTPSTLLAGGDFNEDGLPDIATAGYDVNTNFWRATIALSSPSQTFTTSFVEPTNRYLASITVGDFHDSGHLDLLFVSAFNGVFGLSLFRGHGDGSFGFEEVQPLTIPNSSSYPMAAGRFDSDSQLDLALAVWDPNQQTGSVLLLRGHGDGTFAPPIETPLPAPPQALAAADFDGDGHLDLAVAMSGYPAGRLFVLRGAGDGTFAVSAAYEISASPSYISITDLDGDGAPDLAVGDFNGSLVSILRGDGHGGFAPPYAIGVGWPVNTIAVADFDRDGHPDLLTAGGYEGKASLLFGFGDGTFTPPATWVSAIFPSGLVLGDFDGDGWPDAAVSDGYVFEGGVAVLWNSRVGPVSVAPATAFVSQPAVLHANGGGHAAIAYRWRKNGAPLSDGGAISGSHTAILTIDPVSFADAGPYDVIVTDSCTSVISNAATLSVEFADVSASSPFHDDIIAVATAGITRGCGGADYCPASPVRRDQMAVFLLKAEHGSSYVPPPCTGVFADVPCPGPFTDWIEQLASEGITGGCGGGNYCPSSSITRAQMAVLLLKTLLGSSYTPPPATGIFGDVPVGSFAADFIEDLFNRGITGGCSASPLLYCPTASVLRQQMATFLVRTFGIP